MWHRCANDQRITTNDRFVINETWPICNEAYLVEDTQKYPVQFNGKVRYTFECPKDTPKEEVEKLVLAHDDTAKYLNGAAIKKIIVVPGRIVNIVM